MATDNKGRVAAGCLAAVAISGQALAGLFYVATYTPDPIGGGGGLGTLTLGLAINILMGVTAASALGFVLTWPRRGEGSPPHEPQP